MMKKYSLLIVSLLWVSFSFGQILYEDFSSALTNENFSKIGWTNFAEEGTVVFQGKYSDTDDNTYMQISASGSGETSNIAWLVTPSVYITPGYVLNFRSKSGFTNADALSLWISSNFSDDVSAATWAELSFSKPTDDGTSFGNWQASGVNLESYAGLNVCIAFKYTGGDPSATTIIQIDDIKISQDAKVWVNPATFIEEVEAGSVVNKTFTISNIGGGVLAWERSAKSFTKANHADWELEENQLWLTNEVSITRKNSQGLFNIAQETGYNYASPIGTLWSYGLSHEISMGDYQVWVEAINNNPPAQVGKDLSMHIIDTDIYFDIVFSSWTQGGNGGGFSLDYTLAQAPWITTSVQLGSIASGASQVVNVTFDASNLVAGEHHSQIQFYTNDPEAPIASIPVLLTVVGEPEINIAETAINFGDVFVNGNSTYELNIENTGTDVLNIASIVSDEAAFEANLSSFIIEPSSAQKVIVSFNPTEVKEYTGTLTINSDDADENVITIALSGNGIAAPEVSIDPTFFDVTITGCDVIQSETLTISNSGKGDLNWELITFQDYYWKDSKQPDGPVFSWFDISEIGTFTYLQGDDNSVAVELPFTFNFYGQDKNSMLVSTNGYVTFGGDGTEYSNEDIPNTNIPNDYIAPLWDDLEGVGVGKNYYYHDTPNARFIVQYSDWPNLNGSGTYDFQIHLYANGEIYFYYQNLNGTLNGSTIGIENADGTEGLKIAYNQDYLENNLAIKISNLYPFDSNPSSGSIAAGGSQEVTLTFDSKNEIAGTDLSSYYLKSNDPVNPIVEVPISFTVIKTPTIELSKASIDFLNVVTGDEHYKTLAIRNIGCETLEVTAITSLLAEFTTDAVLPFTLEPNESIEIVVTFTPADELVYEGTLTITNNDEEKVVTLSGEGVAEAPAITLSENSFAVTSDICDEAQTYPLTISNTTGLANLNYEIVQNQGGELVTLHSGTVAPSGSVIENIEVDATGLNSGDYNYTLYVNSNDPANPSIAVSYTLTVNGLPDITVSPTSINFGDVLANDQSVEKFTITNDGCETLNVTDITSTLPEFTVDITNFSLLPDESRDVEVTFSPLSNISYNGTLTIVNDDSEELIEVIGVGLPSPKAEVDPVSLAVTLEGCDDIQVQSMSIINSGTGDLNWELVAFQDYYWKDSKQPDGPVFEWFDISEIGTFTNLQGDDNFVVVDLPFTFNFYGQDKNSMLVSTNGYVTFGGDGTEYSNEDIPNTNIPNDYIAPLWDDLEGDGDGTNYYYYDSPKARFIVQYSDWPNRNGSGTYDFQIHLYANGEIYFYYQNLNGTLNESTVGIENSDGTEGLQIASYQDYLENNLAIKISNIYPIYSSSISGTIAASGSQEVSFTFNSKDYGDGTDLNSYFLKSNDPANPIIEIPVSVTVVGKPEILMSDEAFDFGEVIKDQPSTKTLVITNTGCKELNITDIVSSAAEFTVNNTVFTILPDETVEVEVTFTPVDVLTYNGTLTIVNDDVEQVITLTGSGIGAPEISAVPASFTLTAVNCDEQIAETLTISNIGVSDLNWEVDPVAGIPTWLTMSSYVGTVNASGSIEIELLIDAAGLITGVYSSNIVIGSNDPANPSVSIPVSLTVEGTPAIVVSPIALDFGQVNDGDSYQIDIEISNNGCADLEVTNIESDNAIFTISGTVFTVTPGNTEVVTVTYSPVTEGEHTGTLTITSNDAEQTVALVGEALSAGTPIVQVIANPLNFGDVYLGEVSAVQQFTVSGANLTEDIAISVPYGFQISVNSGGDFVNSMSLVQVGGVVTERIIYVRFAPTARKAYSELVSHVSAGAAQKDVAVTGNGIVSPNIYTSVQTLTFDDVFVNYQSAEQTYNISASGLAEDLIVTAPDGFVISNTSGGDFGNTLSYTPADGIVPTSTVFVKFTPSALDTYVADIEHLSTGATTKLVAVSGISLETYAVTFNVTDGTDPISGAEVALTGYGTQTTDATGIAIFADVLPEAAMAYTVTAADYDDASGTVTVVDADVAEGVTMVLTTYNVTFTVTDGTDPISGAEVALTGYGTQTTDATGIAIFVDVLPEAAMAYTVTAAGYNNATGSVTVGNANVTENVTMVLTTYTVSFAVTSQSEEPVEGAEIVINETHNLTTDASGTATIELINGNYSFTVAKDGYEKYADDFTVAGQDVAIDVAINTTGIETEPLSTVKAYPNPFTTSITIENASAVKYIVINNLIGQKVMEIQLNGLNTETIATDKLTSGVYLVTFKNDRGVVEVKKMVKQ
ncbi:choice-of-anchor D domain-containing protein [Perlabentimonas gracilis]|uniref:choice-of-anchor D domain-containing protein n=1 Tax=Perlabentimonas gracilis TaxID=2715279 RepID=UPI00140B1D3F|nr:choice-of-anchor D domain-containing protein [Perlabentimonas gracilis]NHB68602.1 choice-of-anchor D domain-containing protein [Perlabentimonas gracilis]